MAWGTKLVDMELTDDDKIDSMACQPTPAEMPDYPWGLRICLTEKELEKLGLDADCECGDTVDLRAMGRVTSVSLNEVNGEQTCRIEIQIEQLAVENESTEDDDD